MVAVTAAIAGPFLKGEPYQGDQTPASPGTWYRKGLPAFEAAIKGLYGKSFVDLSGDQQDEALRP
jgi:gluconate 2-dehydrogenase gamma chain